MAAASSPPLESPRWRPASPTSCRVPSRGRVRIEARDSGVDFRTVQDLGGWKQIKMVMRYSRLSADQRLQAVERIAQATPSVEKSESLKAAR